MTTKEVFEHHGEAFGAADVEEILKDYTEASVLYTPDGPFKGLKAIRRFFQKAVTELMPPGMAFEMKHMTIDGDVVFIVWSASTPAHDIPMGTDTFLVRDGKIAVQTFAAQIVPKKK
jgi:ketosteroid isomerase-like protein